MEDIVLTRIVICGERNPLAVALREELMLLGCEIVTVGRHDLRLPPGELSQKFEGAQSVINLLGEPYVAKWSGRYEFDLYKSRCHLSPYRTPWSMTSSRFMTTIRLAMETA